MHAIPTPEMALRWTFERESDAVKMPLNGVRGHVAHVRDVLIDATIMQEKSDPSLFLRELESTTRA